ncbi:MAG: hypothetical protein IJX99_02180 [Clostridia bacterium]|nr:hypothetical protein [Clostridia bacterium]
MDGDTTGLDKALKDTNKEINTTQKELKEVERLLKLDPKNTELLAQKQELLGKQIEQTKTKVTALKDAQKNADNQMKNGVEISQTQYRKLQREIAASENSIEKLSSEAKKSEGIFENLGTTFSKVGNGMKSVASSIGKGIASIGATAGAAVTGIIALEQSTREYRSDLSKLETNTNQAGLNFGKMQDNLTSLVAITDETDSSIEALSNLMQTGFDDAGIEKTLDSLSGAIIAFPDTLKIESLADGLQETLATGKATGQFAELLERSGMSLDTFNAGLEKATENGKQQEYVLEQLAKTGMAEVNKAYREANVNLLTIKEAQQEFNNSMATLSTIMEPAIASIMSFGAELLNILTSAYESGGLEGLVVAIGDVLNRIVTKIVESMPKIIEMGMQIIQGLLNGIQQNLPQIMSSAVEMISIFVKAVLDMLPQIIEVGMTIIAQLLIGIAEQMPELVPAIVECVLLIVETILDNIDQLIDAGLQILMALIQGIINSLPLIIEKLPVIVTQIFEVINNNLPIIIEAGITILLMLIQGIIETIPELVKAIPQIVTSIVDGFKKFFSTISDIGKNIVEGIWEGMKNAKDWLIEKIQELCSNALGAIKRFFGIESPSKVMRDEVGKYLAEGIGVGFNSKMPSVIEAMKEKLATVTSALSTELNFAEIPQIEGNKIISENSYVTKNYTNTIETIRQPSNIELSLNGMKFARAIIPSLDEEYVRMGVKV